MSRRSRERPYITILADDLSGAADCAVAFAQQGEIAAVTLNPNSRTPCQVLSIDTDSRHLTSSEAAQVSLAQWNTVNDGYTQLYKKIDSTLRGNWTSEIAALLPVAGMAIVAPALPAMSRTTLQGRQYVEGIPVEQTEIWRNSLIEGNADICAMLAQHNINAELLDLSLMRSLSDSRLQEWLRHAHYNGYQAVVCDSENDDDLCRLAKATMALLQSGDFAFFWVGSSGLSQQLSLVFTPIDADISSNVQFSSNGPVLTVVGSMSSISHSQVIALHKAFPESLLVAVDIHELLSGEVAANAITDIKEALQAKHDVVVQLTGKPDPDIDGRTLSQAFANALSPVLLSAGAIVVTGGETARALLTAANIDQLSIVRELEPGLVLSISTKSLPIVTKAGGFGTEESLKAAQAYLKALPL